MISKHPIGMVFYFFLAALVWATPSPVLAEAGKQNAQAPSCIPAGRWQIPGDHSNIDETRLIKGMAKRPVVLLGETHTNAEHHRWQLHTVAALFARNPNMVLGFESFPRSVQSILDRWSRGDLTEKDFLRFSRWNDVWRYDSELYLPLFHFARMHRIPMRALNIERDLIRRASKNGWSSIPTTERRGVGTPRPPSEAYRKSLKDVFSLHGDDKEGEKELSETGKKMLAGFIEVQTIWDRAMAEAIADVRNGGGEPLVVAIVGRGHIEYGYGISHQLSDLDVDNAAILLPWEQSLPCADLESADGIPVADAVFGLHEPRETSKPHPPMLGVQIEAEEKEGIKGIRIVKVVEASVAEAAGLEKEDLIVEAAGLPTTRTEELVGTIHRHNPGAWLPLRILRNGESMEIIAKFPARSKQGHEK